MKFRNIYIESKSKCSFKLGYLIVTTSDDVKKIHLNEISSIVIESTDCFISSYLLQEIAKNNILLISCDERHNPVGEFLPLYGNYRCPKKLITQMNWGAVNKKRTWQQIVIHKIKCQADVLELYDCNASSVLREYSKNVKSGDSTYQEAKAASLYFKSLFGIGYSRKQDSDINASLNYGYAVLLAFINRQIVSRGYVTQFGICHKNEFNQFNLGCDFMEPFRPFVDYVVLDCFSDKFNKEIRTMLTNIFNNVVNYDGGHYKLASVISNYLDDCFRSLNNEINYSEIKEYKIA